MNTRYKISPEELDTLRALSTGMTLREIAAFRKADFSEYPISLVRIHACVSALKLVFGAPNATALVYKAAKADII